MYFTQNFRVQSLTTNFTTIGCTAPIFSTDGTRIIMQMGIPDELLGSIIGKQGSVIKEISAMSGAHCQVSLEIDLTALI